MDNTLRTVSELSEHFRVHPNTVYRWVGEGKIPHTRINGKIRFKGEAIEELLEKWSSGQKYFQEFLPSELSSLALYDRMLLNKRSSAMSAKNSRRWNYGFGAVFTKKTKQGITRYYVDFCDEGGRRIQKVVKHARTREEAVIELQTQVQEVFARRTGVRPRIKRKRLEALAELYMRDYSMVNKRSWKTDRSCLIPLTEFFGAFYLDEITSQHVERYKAFRLAQDVEPSTVNRDLAILRKMLNLAVEWHYLNEAQVPRIRLFSERDNLKERILTSAEERRLLEESAAHLRPVLLVALNTGMRRGEILGLMWRQVDLESRVVRVERSKSGRVRHIPLNDVLVEVFTRLRSERGEAETVFPYGNVRTAFEAACRRAGIEGLRFHDLRHTFATRLIKRGVDIITVKELLGHSSVTVTERYTHSFKDQKRSAVDALIDGEAVDFTKAADLLNMCETAKRAKCDKRVKDLFSVN